MSSVLFAVVQVFGIMFVGIVVSALVALGEILWFNYRGKVGKHITFFLCNACVVLCVQSSMTVSYMFEINDSLYLSPYRRYWLIV